MKYFDSVNLMFSLIGAFILIFSIATVMDWWDTQQDRKLEEKAAANRLKTLDQLQNSCPVGTKITDFQEKYDLALKDFSNPRTGMVFRIECSHKVIDGFFELALECVDTDKWGDCNRSQWISRPWRGE